MRLLLIIAVLSVPCLQGCSKTEPTPVAGSPTSAQPPAGSADAKHAAAVSASQFLHALAKGDEATAVGRLTPLAAQRLATHGKRFAFSAVDAADFRVTKLWQPKPDEAAVEYHMMAKAGNEAIEFDLCCFMKNVDGDWRLGGIAYDLGDGQQPVVVNYEAVDPAPTASAAEVASAPATGTEIPRTSQSPNSTQAR
jgi:hypothetical protein